MAQPIETTPQQQQQARVLDQNPTLPREEERPTPASDRDLKWKQFARRNPRLRMFLIIGLVVLALVGIILWRYFSSYESTDDAQIDAHLNSISARVPGHVLKLLVNDNDYVQAGTPLVIIDPSDYQVAASRAKANYEDALATARAAQANVPITSVNTASEIASSAAGVENARSGIAAARQQYDAAVAQQAQAEANNVNAQADLLRYQQLVQKQEISQQRYDQAVNMAKAAAAQLDAARAGVKAASAQVAQAQSKLSQAQAGLRYAQTAPQQVSAIRSKAQSAEANVDRMKAELDQAQLNLGYTTVVAPVSGIVTGRTVEVGQNLQAGQELMRVINLDDIWVTANFKETQLRDMKVGQPATIDVDANGKKYKGHVQSLAGASGSVLSILPPENATGNYVKVVQRLPVKITFDPGETKEHVLRPGMSATPKVWIR
jgi:membrane fusion protein, multidrug efflux system